MSKIHKRSIRFRNNAGIPFPVCQTNAKLLNMDATAWETSFDSEEVTCKNCKREMVKDRWA